MAYIPEQGDIIWIDFDPSSGQEIMKRRPAFVISKRTFNAHVKMAIVAPISSTIRGVKLEVVLPNDTDTQGAAMVYQLKSIDFIQRKAKFIEKAPIEIIKQVCNIAQVLIQY
jgi:mRNA interferase MazF/mRNA interferase ChpB